MGPAERSRPGGRRYPAIGTTGFGVASAAGFPDGARASRDPNRSLAEALCGLTAFVSFDVEDGYSDDPGEVAAYADLQDRLVRFQARSRDGTA